MRKPTLEGLNGMGGTYICVRQFESLQKREISIRPVRTDVRRTLIKKKKRGDSLDEFAFGAVAGVDQV